jgi:hypothetical protein
MEGNGFGGVQLEQRINCISIIYSDYNGDLQLEGPIVMREGAEVVC